MQLRFFENVQVDFLRLMISGTFDKSGVAAAGCLKFEPKALSWLSAQVCSSDWINAIRGGVHASSDLDYLERVTVNC